MADDIVDAGGEAVAHAGDATDFDYADSLVEATVAEYGRLDGVANFVGVLRDGIGYKLSAEDWRRVVETNLTGQFTVLRAAARHWRETAEGAGGNGDDDADSAGGGGGDGFPRQRSYLAASARSARGNVGQSNYAASKAGILGLVRSTSSELYRLGVRVNALVPNAYTRMTETVPEEHRPYTREEMPPERVAAFVAYHASEAADDITGCALYAGGDRVGVFSDPTLDRVGVSPGGWSVDDLAEHFREDVAGDVELTRTDSYF